MGRPLSTSRPEDAPSSDPTKNVVHGIGLPATGQGERVMHEALSAGAGEGAGLLAVADRALDAEVAEKVMGWRWVVHSDRLQQDQEPQHRGRRFLVSPDRFPETFTGAGWNVPPWRYADGSEPIAEDFQTAPYSTDIAAAWEVVERMREHGWSITLHCSGQPLRPSDLGAFVVSWFRLKPEPNPERDLIHTGNAIRYIAADTAPLAISLASLAAVVP